MMLAGRYAVLLDANVMHPATATCAMLQRSLRCRMREICRSFAERRPEPYARR